LLPTLVSPYEVWQLNFAAALENYPHFESKNLIKQGRLDPEEFLNCVGIKAELCPEPVYRLRSLHISVQVKVDRTLKYHLGEYELDPRAYALSRGSTPAPVSRKPFEVLLYLVKERHRVVTRHELVEQFWEGHEVYEENLTKCISELRKALGDQQKPHRHIETLPAVGYRYIGVVEELAPPRESFTIHNETADAATLSASERAQDSPADAAVLEAEHVPAGFRSHMTSTARPRPSALIVTLLLAFIAAGAVALSVYSFRGASKMAPPSPGAIHSLAILPFELISEHSRDEFLELGMADALITKLSNLVQVSVLSTGSVRKYAGLTQDPIAAGKELKVDSVLEGTVQKQNERIRVTVRLLRVSDRSFLWGETFDEQFADIFSLQDSISERVAQALAVRLNSPEKERITKGYTDNGEAYQLYQAGRYSWNKRTEDGLLKSIGFMEQATLANPQYATAYAGLADAYIAASNFNLLSPEEVYPKAKSAARKAIQIDNSLGEAHAALAFSTMLFDWNWADSEREFRKAVDLSPKYGPAHQWYAVGLASAGRFDEAIAEASKAQHADPLSLFINAGIGWVSYLVRDYDRTILECTKTLEMEPGFAPAHVYRGMAYEQKGMFDKAIADLEAARDSQERPSFSGALGHAYAVAGKKAEARMLLRDLKESSAKHYFPPYYLALIYVGLGEREEALNLLERAYEERYPWLIHLNVDPRLDPLRSEPRFKNLVSRIGWGQTSVASSK
jgi:TolB-like protein/DNA-binding winged helix-turn-helix (wHTH) protein/Tfp pilus assembly protein PilF